VERAQLALALARDSLSLMVAHPDIDQVMVVAGDDEVMTMAAEYGAQAFDERVLRESGLNAALKACIAHYPPRGDEVVLVVHGDLPLIGAAEISEAIALQKQSAGLVIGCDSHGSGTNLLAFNASCRPNFAFGPDSCQHHQRQAQLHGISCQVLIQPGIGLDIDCPQDFNTMLQQSDYAALGAHTRRFLENWYVHQPAVGDDQTASAWVGAY